MKRILLYFLLVFAITLSACEKKEEISCLPQRVTTRTPGAGGSNSIISDLKYVNDTLDHIIFSNYQTHYYFYNESGNLEKVTRNNVQTFRKLESVLLYEDGILVGTNEYVMNLDRTTQEDLDTTLSGKREFEFGSGGISGEKVYIVDEADDTSWILDETISYEYDLSGNIVKYIRYDEIEKDTIAAFSYTYDSEHNIYKSVGLFFEGKSYVNNIKSKTDLLDNAVYDYQMSYSLTGYPEQISVKEGSILTELVTVDYLCK